MPVANGSCYGQEARHHRQAPAVDRRIEIIQSAAKDLMLI